MSKSLKLALSIAAVLTLAAPAAAAPEALQKARQKAAPKAAPKVEPPPLPPLNFPPPEPPPPVSTFGGLDSCSAWLRDTTPQNPLRWWIVGFWSGRNFEGPDKQVGKTTDGVGIVREVKVLCETNPSLTLLQATMQTYDRFKAEGR